MPNKTNISPEPLNQLIAGQSVASSQHYGVINPCDETVIAHVPNTTIDELDQAITAAQKAMAWSVTDSCSVTDSWPSSLALRQRTLAAIAKTIMDNQQPLAKALSLETGLPFANTKDEVAMAAYFFTYRSRTVAAIDTLHDDNKQHVRVVRKAIGVVAAIIPWNAPIMIASEKIATAFAAGNTVVLKTSPKAPVTLLLLANLLKNVVPAGVLNVLSGGDDIGKAMTTDKRIGMVSFTGSTQAGKAIMTSGGASLKRLSLELGGNDPAIVLADANPTKVAAKIFWGAFYRCGQICAAIKRVYVHASIHDEFVAAIAALAAKIIPADAFAEGTLIGPLANAQQFEKIQSVVARSLAAGGQLHAGGKALDQAGYYYSPTIISDVDASNPLVREEQFGPALPIIKYSNIDDAIAQANDTEYGLGASVWATDIAPAEAVAVQIQAGSVWVNRHGIVMPDIPFGGFKESGIGRANGAVGLDAYSELQTVSIAKPRQ